MGYTKSKELFANKDALPQAIICSTDSIAYAVLKAAEDSNVEIPEEVKKGLTFYPVSTMEEVLKIVF